MSVPAAMALCGAGWLWVLFGASAAAAVSTVLRWMQRRSGLTLARGITAAFGTYGGRVVTAVTWAWLLLAAAGTACACQRAFGQTLGAFGPAVPLFLAALMSRTGKVGAARVSGVVVLILTILYSIFVLGAVQQVRWEWCVPQGTVVEGTSALSLCLTPVAIRYFTECDELPRRAWGSGALCAILPGLLAFMTAACLSPELARREVAPLQTLGKSLSVLSVMQRFEVLLSVAQLLGLTVLIGALACAAQSITWETAPKMEGKTCTAIFCLLAFGASFTIKRVPVWVWTVGAAIFWGILPILTQFIVNIKKPKKL